MNGTKKTNNNQETIALTDSIIYDFEAEHLVIASLIGGYEPDVQEITPCINEQCFIHPTCREIYQAIVAAQAAGVRVDIVGIGEQLKKRGSELTRYDLMDIYQQLRGKMIYTDTVHLAKRLRELEHRRKLVNMGYALADLAQDEEMTLQQINSRLQDFINDTPAEIEMTTVGTAADKVYEIMEQNINEDHAIGTYTGFRNLDAVGGLHPGDLIIVAGDTSNGKTSFALSITDNAIARGHKIAYYSLEMSDYELTARILAFRTGIDVTTQLYRHSAQGERDMIRETAKRLPRENLLFDDRATVDFESILASIRSLKKTTDIQGVIVDYIQILNVNNKGRETQEQLMAQVARRLKNIAKELNIWVMALSQLNRNSQNPEPTLARLRDSGQIAEAADVVILIYRPELYHKKYSEPYKSKTTQSTAQIEVAKGRNIGLMRFLVRFNATITHFFDAEIPDMSDEENTNKLPEINDDEEKPF